MVEVRRHAGFMIPGPIQLAAALALEDDAHVDVQREIYRRRLTRFIEILEIAGIKAAFRLAASTSGCPCRMVLGRPTSSLVKVPSGRSHRYLAEQGGMLVSPGDFYGPGGVGYVRIAMIQPDDRLELVAERFAARFG